MDSILAAVPRPTIKEALFVKKYIHLFVNKEDSQISPEIQARAMTIWLNEVAVTPYSEVDIIAKDDKGNDFVRFSIPPVWDNDTILFDRANINIAEEISIASDKAGVIEAQGVKHIYERIIPNMKRQVPKRKYLDRWNAILTFYGFKPITNDEIVTETNVETTPVEAKLTDDDDFDIDSF